MRDITRRGFVAGSVAALGVAAVLGETLESSPSKKAWAIPVNDDEKVSAADGEYHGYCAMCMERGACGNVVTVKDGVVVNVEGDVNRPSNRGSLCPRGKGAIMNMYNPYRIKAPMKRTNPEKGMDVDPGWVEISWDEAIDIAAQKLREVHDRDPRELVNLYGFAAYETSHATFGHGEWCLEFGSPNESSAKGQMCSVHYGGSYIMNAFPTVNYDSEHTKYILQLGKGMGMDMGSGDSSAQAYVNAMKGGMKNVLVSPYCALEGSRGEWIPIIPGTDLSLIYALMHTIVYEIGEYDVEFLKSRTNGTYLIAADGDYARDANGKPVMVDADGSIKAFDDPSFSDPRLEGRFEFNGETCPTGFTLFKEAIADFNADWASEKCGIPAETIRRIANELVEYACIGSTVMIDGEELPLRPACVVMGRNTSNHTDGTLQDIFSRVLNLLLGNVGFPGGIQSTKATSYKPNSDGVVTPSNEATAPTEFNWPPASLELKDFMPHRHSVNTVMMKVMCDPEKWGFDYKPTLVFSQGSNPIVAHATPDVSIEAMKSVDYVIYHACYHMDEMALMSDLLLPEDAALETTAVYMFPGVESSTTVKGDKEYLMNNTGIVMKHGVGALYNTREANSVLIDIFDKAGLIRVLNNVANNGGCIGVPKGNGFGETEYALDPDKKYDVVEMWDRCMKALTKGVGLEYFDDPTHTIYPIVSYKNEAEFYTSNRDKTTRFSLYLHDQLEVGKWLIPQIEATGVDTFNYVGCDIDELKRRYTALPYYPSDDLRPTFNAPAEYDLRATHVRKPMFLFRMGSMDQNPLTRDWSKKFDPENGAVLINRATAETKGISDGDIVVVESQFGKTHGPAYLTERCEPSTVAIVGVLGRRAKTLGEDLVNDLCFNEIVSGDFGYIDPIDGAFDTTVRVKVYKA